MPGSIKSDLTIIGAGPAGITSAIVLAKKGIPCLLIDKHGFPREKICGDGIGGKAVSILRRLDPAYARDLEASGFATGSYAVRFYSPRLKMMELSFEASQSEGPPGFVCKRTDFDNFMLEKALSFREIRFVPGIQVFKISRRNGVVILEDKDGMCITETRLVLFAAGADRPLIRQLDPSYPDFADEGIGVRGYFENVTGFDEKRAIEIHFLKELLPWYLWIFPFSDGSANAGLALPGKLAKKIPLSLKDLLLNLLVSYPHLKDRFKNAGLSGKIEAGRLPVYSGRFPIAGDNYLLLGDAARLIDPFTGEGIGNAMASGSWAAEIAAECLSNNIFSHSVTRKYEERVYSGLGAEMELSLRLQGLARRRLLLNLVIGRASSHEGTRKLISEMLYDTDAKRKLDNPLFYMKLLFGL